MTQTSEFLIEEDDLEWLRENFPDLTYKEGNPGKISGILAFGMEYIPDKKRIDLYQFSKKSKSRNNLIHDKYEIEINLEKTRDSIWPQVYETGKRIPRKQDFHCYGDGNLCLTTSFEEVIYSQNGFNLREFMTKVVVPHFYSQSFHEKYDHWPWGEYSHGVLGLLESFANIEKHITFYKKLDVLYKICHQSSLLDHYLNSKTNPYSVICPCGSLRPFSECHSEAFKGYQVLKKFWNDVLLNHIDRQLAQNYLDPTNILMIQGWRQ